MSDTQAKIEKRRKEAQKQKAKNQKRANAKIKPSIKAKMGKIAVIVVACLIAVAVIVPNLSFNKRLVNAMTVGETKFNTAEFSYSYINAFYSYYNAMVSYVGEQYVGISTTTSLKKQQYSEDMTYSEYFVEMAKDELTRVAVLNDLAKKAGFELSDEKEEEFKTLMESLKKTAESYGMSVKKYVRQVYGKGFTPSVLEDMTYMSMIAEEYQQHLIDSYEYTLEDMEKYYGEHKNDYDKLTIRFQKFGVSAATSNKEEVTLQDAKEVAEKFFNKVDGKDEDAFADAALDYAKENSSKPEDVKTENTLKENTTYSTLAYTSEELAKWAVDEDRKAGDCEIITIEKDGGYIVAYMVEPAAREEYNTVDVRHILVSIGVKEDDAKYKEKKEEAKKEAEKLLKEWKDGEATPESFGELADKKSDDGAEGGRFEQVYKGQMVEEFNDWIFDEDRKEGDCEIVLTEYGYHIILFEGENDPYWQVNVDNAMRNNDYNDYYEEEAKKYEVQTSALGIWYRNEPFK